MNFSQLLPLFISFTEISFIIFVLVMVFGADKIPEIAKGLGKSIRGIKSATDEIKGEVMKNVYDFGKETGEITDVVKKHIGETSETKEDFKTITAPIKRRH